jgi:hypothetical protein
MTFEKINAQLKYNYSPLVLTITITWLLSAYVKTDLPQKDTYFEKHAPEDIIRSPLFGDLEIELPSDKPMRRDYILGEDLNTLAAALFGQDEHGYYYAKEKTTRVYKFSRWFSSVATLNFDNN